ncbi:hypothetical protein CI109_104094 [Kwoniella shandongensis]|uniref:Uncharacterized protein n=1 Tax=Kwoniella shandongensis TaxID=1734106 RepID=A0A5M6BXN6_9TREE|nr:uncharacterized protein CI109_004021 [Kwoniella shandongensis]KAA5527483.1 hypothetical protein CI109_004021 [Kwoniella shandongensis]
MSAAEEQSPSVDASAPAPPPAEAPSSSAADEQPDKPASSPAKKPSSPSTKAKPAKGRASLPGGSKKGGAAASAADEKRTFEVGDIVLARLRGYPPWPARIADPETLPRNVLSQRPGKSPFIYCCQFFPAGDFSWLQSKEIKPLSSSEISTYLSEPHRKPAGGLREAYQTAQDPTEWDSQQQEIHKAREEAEAEANANVDELEDEDEEEVATGGKRKRSAAEKKDKKKKAKTAAKAKNGASAADSEEEAPKSKAKAKPAAKPKAEAAKSSKASASKTENQEPVDDDPLASNPECIKVKDWRHKLQRAFLSKSLPTAEEMTVYDDLFKTIESYDSITIEALQYSKIGKVMKKIQTLTEIPRDDELKITERAGKLMHQWTDFINNEGKPNGESAASATNGETKSAEKPAEPEADKSAEPAKEETVEEVESDKKSEEAAPAEDEKMEVEA